MSEVPEPCKEDIYKNGKAFMALHAPSAVIEAIVQTAAKRSQLRMDWHFIAGIGVIKTLDDVDESIKAIHACMPHVAT